MPDVPQTRSGIRPVKERVEDELLARSGVTGVDINVKSVNGVPTGQLSIVVYVDKKMPKNSVAKGEMIPAEIDGIPTDVQEERIELQQFGAISLVEPQVDVTKYTPLKGGISMGPCRSVFLEPPHAPAPGNYVFTGTFGAVVKDRSSGARMALTNFHVACIDAGWSVGDTMCQPSRVDGGTCPADVFGTLSRAVLSENVDGAVVAIDAAKPSDCSIEAIGAVKGNTVAAVGMAVRKRGRTTELTYGTVDSIDVSVSIDYGDGLGLHTLKHQIRVVPDVAKNARFSNKGDSGSVVVNSTNWVIGLLFAGTTSGSATYLNPIKKALDELDVDLCVKPTPTIVTKPILCEPVISKKIICVITKPVTCDLVTKPVVCNILTAPKFCEIKTAATCPPVTLACPIERRPPTGEQPFERSLGEVYGRPDTEGIEDAFWFGYYTALEKMSEAEAEEPAQD